ncbi:hypothetical protein PVAND_015462 [Polypedilum vanderplanki]|uniref:Uncharacterized protein n=1 Tax=Polypedilum vanderplanki TaxID=319348 RepID=A0A9J6BCP7_POLVA|nr:hypothetical protein PVAND_015462 [Polypedilum vanderplanki]
MKVEIEKYFESSTIHGFKYLSKKFHWIERIFWVLSLLASITITILLIYKLIIKIQNVPIVISITDNAMSIADIDFPGVTICYSFKPTFEYNKSHEYFYDHFANKIKNVDKRDKFQIYYVDILNAFENNEIKFDKLDMEMLEHLQVVDLITDRGVFATKNLSISTENIFKIIKEFQRYYEKSIYFHDWTDFTYVSESVMKHKLCITYNIPPHETVFNLKSVSDDFCYEYAKEKKNSTVIIPKRAESFSQKLLINSLYVGSNKGEISNSFEGQSISLHDPYEFPSIFLQPFQYNFNIRTTIQPQFITIDESLYNTDVSERNCFHPDERQLKIFKVYTKNNCLVECLTEFMIQKCDCVEFFMIRNFTTRICSASEKKCFDKAKREFENHLNYCNCLDPCTYVKYIGEFKRKELDEIIFINKKAQQKIYVTILNYKSMQITEIKRKLQFNEIDFLSFVGGLLGLFAGFSALSFIEILYWMSLKFLILFRRQKTAIIHPMTVSQVMEIRVENRWKYLENSSIHGFSYLYSKKFFEMIIWSIFTSIALSLCFAIILNFQYEYSNSFTVGPDDAMTFRGLIPFPAVTLIPSYFVDEKLFYKYTRDEYTDQELKSIFKNQESKIIHSKKLAKMIVCFYRGAFTVSRKDFKVTEYYYKILNEIAPDEWFKQQYAIWNDKFQVNFSRNFIYNKGIIYTFNMMDSKNLLNYKSVHDDFIYKNNISMLRQRSMPKISNYSIKVSTKYNAKFQLRIKEQKFNDSNLKPCRYKSIVIHKPETLLRITTDYDEIKINHSMNIEITPKIIQTDKSLRKIDPFVRDCYFKNEKKLKYFKIYTEQFCKMECFVTFLKKKNDCREVYTIYENNDSRPFCLSVSSKFLKDDLENNENFSFKQKCSCLPTCDSTEYHVNIYPSDDDADDNETFIINVKMYTENMILFRRYQQFSFFDAVSYVGGLLGLFAGISVLSIVEIFYFITLRLFDDILRLLKRT